MNRKSPLRSTKGLSSSTQEAGENKPSVSRVPKKCKHCKEKLSDEDRAKGKKLHDDCIPMFADAYASKAERARVRRETAAKRKAARAEREQTKARKEKLKRIPDLIREAQVEFNRYIRTRDADKPCICCGLPLHSGSDVGGSYDAGHYRSTGSAPHLRFDESNVHAQRKHCNRHGAGRAVDYRIGLIQRIGLGQVERLESDNRIHRWTREELEAIKATYRQKTRELLKARGE